MKTYQMMLSTLLIAWLITACTKDEEKPSAIDEHQAQEQPVTSEEKKAAFKTIKDLDKKAAKLPIVMPDKRSVAINGEKFITTTWPVMVKSKLFNVQMGQYGRVKGSYVVVCHQGKALSEAIVASNEVTKIAKDTYRLVPKIESDLLIYYKALQKMEEFSIVELEIDYSGDIQSTEDY